MAIKRKKRCIKKSDYKQVVSVVDSRRAIFRHKQKNSMLALLCTNGQMTVSDVISECVEQKWIPLFIFREINTNIINLPLFHDISIAKAFMKRNLPKKWSHGSFLLCQEDMNVIISKGWNLKVYDFPNKIVDRKDIELGFEIFEMAGKPDYITSKL